MNLLSIITVTKDDLPGLILTYKSIANQNISFDEIHWVVIDGKSSDGSTDYLRDLNPEFSFNYISEKDSGIFDAMNKGTEITSGKYLFFLNSGDVFKDDLVLKNIFTYLRSESSLIVAGKVTIKWNDLTSNVSLLPWVPHQGTFIHNSCFRNLSYDGNMNFYGDLKFWMNLKNQGLFDVERVDLEISNFYMGGAGNNPKNIFRRLKERNSLSIEFGESYIKIIGRIIVSILIFIVWKLFGVYYYYKLIMRAK